MKAAFDADVCVVGGGPAGAATALRLATLGYSVCLLERTTFPRPCIGESLPPSAMPLLRTLGIQKEVLAAAFLRTTGATLYWAGRFDRHGFDQNAHGLQVDRAVFDQLLMDAARNAGVQIHQASRAYRPYRTPDHWVIPVSGPEGKLALTARFLVDAAGRKAAMNRKLHAVSQPLVALYAYWDAPRGFGPNSRVEAGTDCWLWSAEIRQGRVNAIVFLDPSKIAGLSSGARRDAYLQRIAGSTLAASLLEGRRYGQVKVCDATSRTDLNPVRDNLVRVGEAAFSIDPLSSQGITSALAQALQAAATVHTLNTRPENADLAIDFYASRQRDRVTAHATMAAEYYARQDAFAPNQFWTDRATLAPGFSLPPEPEPVTFAANDPIRVCRRTRLGAVPVLDQGIIQSSPGLRHPNLSLPVLFVDGVKIAPLVQQVAPGTLARDVVVRWSTQVGDAKAKRLFRWMAQKRIFQPTAQTA